MYRIIVIIYFVLLSLTGFNIVGSSQFVLTPFVLLAIPLLLYLNFFKIKFSFHNNKLLILLLLFVFVFNVFGLLNGSVPVSSFVNFFFYLIVLFYSLSVVKKIDIIDGQKIFKVILWLYFLNLLISRLFFVLIEKNIFLRVIFGYTYDKGQLRFYAFSSEPSYLAIIITMSILVLWYFKIDNFKKYFIIYVLSLLLSQSSYGLISFFITLIVVNGKNVFKNYKKWLAVLMLLIVSVLAVNVKSVYVLRVVDIVSLLSEFKDFKSLIYSWNLVDSSSFYRISPIYIYIESLSNYEFGNFFGHGLASDVDYYRNKYFLFFGERHERLSLPMIPTIFYILGIIPAMSLIVKLYKNLTLDNKLLYVYFFLIMINCGFQTQLFLFSYMCLYFISIINVNSKKVFNEI